MPILNIASMIFAIVLHFWHLQTELVGVETTRLRLCSRQYRLEASTNGRGEAWWSAGLPTFVQGGGSCCLI